MPSLDDQQPKSHPTGAYKKTVKRNCLNYKPNKWERNLVGDFVLNLYHRKMFQVTETGSHLIEKTIVNSEFRENFVTEDISEILNESYPECKIGTLLKRNGFLIDMPRSSTCYNINFGSVKAYQMEKIEKLDNDRLQRKNSANGFRDEKKFEEDLNYADLSKENLQVANVSPNYQAKYIGTVKQKYDGNFVTMNNSCFVCQIDFESMGEFNDHMKNHTVAQVQPQSFNNEQPLFSLCYKLCKNSHKFCFIVKKLQSGIELTIDKITIVHAGAMIFVNHMESSALTMPAEFLTEDICGTFFLDSHLFSNIHQEKIIFIVAHDEHISNIRFIEQHNVKHMDTLPTTNFNYSPNRLPKIQVFKTTKALHVYEPREQVMKALERHFYHEALMRASIEFAKYLNNNLELDNSNYVDSMRVLLEIEDIDTINKYKKLELHNVELTSFGDEYSFKAKVKGTFLQNVISPYDQLYIREENSRPHESKCSIITNVHHDRITFQCNKGSLSIKDLNFRKIKYHVEFYPSRVNLRYQYKALNMLQNTMPLFKKYILPNNVKDDSSTIDTRLQLFNERIQENPEQLEAIHNIVCRDNIDAPYIIFGPPGTGKTTTIVETILQLLKYNANNKILVTAQTNAACDEVALRICKYIHSFNSARTIVRIYARSNEKHINKMDEVLLENSNMYDVFFLPSINIVQEYRIIVCTLSMVGKLATGGFGEVFTHIFIDEAGVCTETEALVGIVGIINVDCKLIIAGDHKQLGPILKSERAREFGFGTSFMERLIDLECYRVEPNTGNYNRSIQTRLRLNFRSHPDIVNLFSTLFYDDSLVARCNSDDVNMVSKWYKVQSNYPIIFHSIEGNTQFYEKSLSLYNLFEVEAVMAYVKELMYFGIDGTPLKEGDIGIISPYRGQINQIQTELNAHKWFSIEVGSAETFQGREKRIIIVSFVRSNVNNLGFLNNPQRLNVIISRAKSLLILIGNAVTLEQYPLFDNIIQKCQENKSFYNDDIITRKHFKPFYKRRSKSVKGKNDNESVIQQQNVTTTANDDYKNLNTLSQINNPTHRNNNNNTYTNPNLLNGNVSYNHERGRRMPYNKENINNGASGTNKINDNNGNQAYKQRESGNNIEEFFNQLPRVPKFNEVSNLAKSIIKEVEPTPTTSQTKSESAKRIVTPTLKSFNNDLLMNQVVESINEMNLTGKSLSLPFNVQSNFQVVEQIGSTKELSLPSSSTTNCNQNAYNINGPCSSKNVTTKQTKSQKSPNYTLSSCNDDKTKRKENLSDTKKNSKNGRIM